MFTFAIFLRSRKFKNIVLQTLNGMSTDKTQYFVHLRFNSNMQLINGISCDLQELLKCFNGTRIDTFFRTPLATSVRIL